MTLDEAEKFRDNNRHKIDDNATEFKFRGLVIASNTTETREKKHIYKEMYEQGVNNKTVLQLSGDLNSDLNVFIVGQINNLPFDVMPFRDYLEMIEQKKGNQ
jgi:hypothetical protein